jgi:hypothetical protein
MRAIWQALMRIPLVKRCVVMFGCVIGLYTLLSVADFLMFKSTCERQMEQFKPPSHGGLGVFVCRDGQHLFLTDHERSLVVFTDDDIIDSASLYPDAGGGGQIHYVLGDGQITVVDMNGTRFVVDKEGIKDREWTWMQALPTGETHRVKTYGMRRYKDTVIEGAVKLDAVYWYKDPH